MVRFIGAIALLLMATVGFAQVQALTEDRDGAIWMAIGTGLYKILSDGQTEAVPNPVKDQSVNTLAFGKNNELWIGTDEGLFRCSGSSCEMDSKIEGTVRSVASSVDDSLWIATDKELLKQDPSGIVSKPFSTNQVQALAIDQTGNVWIGSGHELMQLEGTKEVLSLPPPPPNVRMRPPITSILPSKSGKLYVGTHQGLLIQSGKTFKKLSGIEVLALAEDRKGNLWIGTSDGLKRFTNGKMTDVPLAQ